MFHLFSLTTTGVNHTIILKMSKLVLGEVRWFAKVNNKRRRRQWHPTPVLLPGKSHRWRSLVAHSPWGREESDTTERLHFHFSLSCTGEGNGNLLHCSCLENPRDGGAWWAAVYGVTQSRTRLKGLSSSSSSSRGEEALQEVGSLQSLTPQVMQAVLWISTPGWWRKQMKNRAQCIQSGSVTLGVPLWVNSRRMGVAF